MQTNLLLLILVAATLLVLIYLVFRVKAVLYLLQQPVVKKMSPQLRLKPVRLDEAMDRNRTGGNREGREGNREGRGERRDDRRDGDRNRDGNREGRGERRDGNREGRPEGNRGEGRDGNREGRGERRDGRDGERGNREGGRGEGRPRREFSETRDFAPSPAPESAPAAYSEPGLPPRRALASFEAPASENVAAAPAAPAASETFVGSGDDMQHGRRTQLKKKPRFDFDEEETPAA
jgi:hypothetical protein